MGQNFWVLEGIEEMGIHVLDYLAQQGVEVVLVEMESMELGVLLSQQQEMVELDCAV